MTNEPRIIFYDIETIPDLQQALENWCDLVPPFPGKKPTMSASVTSCCSFGYRVLGDKKATALNAWDFPAWEKNVNDDKALIKEALKILNSADAVVTFNGKRFDEKYVKTRGQIHKLPALNPKIPHIDLCSVSARNFFLLNNRLKTVAKYFIEDNKLDHDGWPLWVRTHGGVNRKRDEAAEALMSKYNLKDVDLMVPLFKGLRPYITNIPNHNLHTVAGTVPLCPGCGSTPVQRRGYYMTKTKSYHRYQCKDCGTFSRTDINDKNPR